MSNLSEVLLLRFPPYSDVKTTHAFLSYKCLQDNQRAKTLFNGFVFCGKSLVVTVGKECEVNVEASVRETRSIATQTWIMS